MLAKSNGHCVAFSRASKYVLYVFMVKAAKTKAKEVVVVQEEWKN